jgi:hypothetical protein
MELYEISGSFCRKQRDFDLQLFVIVFNDIKSVQDAFKNQVSFFLIDHEGFVIFIASKLRIKLNEKPLELSTVKGDCHQREKSFNK